MARRASDAPPAPRQYNPRLRSTPAGTSRRRRRSSRRDPEDTWKEQALKPVRHLFFRATLAATSPKSYLRIKRVHNAFDIIGDVHGQADGLIALLRHLGYRESNGAWRHSGRCVIFVGDFVDRGPKQIESVMIARRMVDAGCALAVMGNHDFNAVAWYLPDPSHSGDHLRSHSFDNEFRVVPERIVVVHRD